MAETLSDARIRSLKPSEQQTEVRDKLVRGLLVRVSPGGRKLFNFSYRYRGKSRRLTLGSHPDISLACAREIVRDAKKQLALGNDPQLIKKKQRSEYAATLYAAVVDEFVEQSAKPQTSGWRETQRILLRKELTEPWRHFTVDQITGADVDQVLAVIKVEKGPSAAVHAFASVRRFMNWCRKKRYIQSNPCLDAEFRSRPRRRSRVLSKAEIRSVWSAADAMGSPFGPFVHTLILTGQRRSEVAKMRPEHVDLHSRVWTQPTNKSDREHCVYLSDAAYQLLSDELKSPAKFVFRARHSASPISGFSKWKAELDRRSGVRNWCLHDLRRTVATGMAELGIRRDIVELVLNHRSSEDYGIAGIYNRHRYAAEKQAAWSQWDAHLATLLETDDQPPTCVVDLPKIVSSINTVVSDASGN